MSKKKEAAPFADFDPNDLGLDNGNLYGLPHSLEQAETIVIPVPWEVTVSYREGTSKAPQAILEASLQVDLFDLDRANAWRRGLAMLPIPTKLRTQNTSLRKLAKKHIAALMQGKANTKAVAAVNAGCEAMQAWVKAEALKWLKKGKNIALIGGDHSTPLGLVHALADHFGSFGILQIDAHCDLREAYEDFTYSHASVMYNALKRKEVTKLVQVGIRDLSAGEHEMIEKSKGRIQLHDMRSLRRTRFEGKSWHHTCEAIVKQLPQQVYISFDIDGLDPSLCPSTGTPVPDGLGYEEVFYLFERVVASGRRIIACDVVEVGYDAQNDWDAIVGARVLYRLAGLMADSYTKS